MEMLLFLPPWSLTLIACFTSIFMPLIQFSYQLPLVLFIAQIYQYAVNLSSSVLYIYFYSLQNSLLYSCPQASSAVNGPILVEKMDNPTPLQPPMSKRSRKNY